MTNVPEKDTLEPAKIASIAAKPTPSLLTAVTDINRTGVAANQAQAGVFGVTEKRKSKTLASFPELASLMQNAIVQELPDEVLEKLASNIKKTASQFQAGTRRG